MTFGERLVQAREAAGFNQKQLAEVLNITPTRLNYWEKDKRQPDVTMIKSLSTVLNVSADFLIDNPAHNKITPSLSDEALQIAKDYAELDDHGQHIAKIVIKAEQERVKSERAPKPQTPTTKTIPLYLSPAAAGYTSPILGEDYEDYEVPANSEANYAVRIDGDSMEPYIKDKSIVLVKKTVDLDIGDVGIFCVDNDMYCKQYCQDHMGNVYLFSLNRKRKNADITVWHTSGQTVWCFGKVLMKKRVPLPQDRDI